MDFFYSVLKNKLFKDSFLTFLSQIVVIVLAIIVIPVVVKQLSMEEFGVLSLLWGVIGYFSLFDFGLSRAVTKYVAEIKNSNSSFDTTKAIQNSILLSIIIGIVSGILFFLFSNLVVKEWLKIPEKFLGSSIQSFYIASFSVPAVVIYGTLRGIFFAYDKVRVANLFQLSMGILQWSGTLICVLLGFHLVEIIFVTVVVRIFIAVIGIFILFKIENNLNLKFNLDFKIVKQFLNFGGWITISQTISPLYMYLDRFLIGIFSSISVVGFYTLPHEAMSRMSILPTSISTVVFPMLSNFQNDKKQFLKTYTQSFTLLFLLLFSVVLFFIFFSNEILSLWVGEKIAKESALVFMILLCGFFFNAQAQISATVIHSIGKPSVTAKFHLFELLFMIVLNLIFIPQFGIIGAAIVWSLRVIIDFILLHFYSLKFLRKLNDDLNFELFNMSQNIFWTLVFVFIISVGLHIVFSYLFVKLLLLFMWILIFIFVTKSFASKYNFKLS